MKKRDLTTATDTGWAWIMLVGVSIIYMVVAGYVRGFGIFYAALVEEFGSSAMVTSLIQGFRYAAVSISAPIVSGLCVTFTERTVLLFGSSIFSVGLILSYFAPSVEFHVVTLGLMAGIGMTSTSIPSQIAVGKYFDKYRSLANSICFCGSSFGVMSLPPLVMYLIHQYGLRGSFLIYGALLLNCAVGAALIRPFKVANSKSGVVVSNETCDDESGRITNLSDRETLCRQSNEASADCGSVESSESVIAQGNRKTHSVKDHSPSIPVFKITKNSRAQQPSRETEQPRNYESLSNSNEDCIATGLNSSEPHSVDAWRRYRESNDQGGDHSNAELGNSGELTYEEMAEPSMYYSYASLHCIDGSMYLSLGRQCPDTEKAKCSQSEKKRFFALRYFSSCIDFSLFQNAKYMLFVFSTSLSMVAFVNVTIYLIPRAEEYGISRDEAALFLTIAGGCDIFGRLMLGLISDVKKIGPDRVMTTGLFLMGIATLLLPLANTFKTMTVYMVIFGLIGSSGHILSLPIVMKFVEAERMPRAMGLVVSAHGISNVVSPPVLEEHVDTIHFLIRKKLQFGFFGFACRTFTGFIKDRTGTYDSTLYVCGACQLIASALMVLEPLLRRKENCSKNKRRQAEEV